MKYKLTLPVLILALLVIPNSAFLPQINNENISSFDFNDEVVGAAADEKIFDNTVWWIIKTNGPIVQSPLQVYVNGQDKGTAYHLKFGHKAAPDWPEIAVIYNTGYVRLTPFRLPYGSSFILGPAYWDSSGSYTHIIQISRIDITTPSGTSDGPIELKIYARDFNSSRWPDYRMDIAYQITLPVPSSDSTQMVVTESFTVANGFSLSASRQASHEGFKWLQFSSMYIDSTYHDSDGALYVGTDEKIRVANFSPGVCNGTIFPSPSKLSSNTPWVEVLHRNDESWQGNTPNTIFQLTSPGFANRTIAQGYIVCTSDPNDDNVGVWVNDEAAPMTFSNGNTGSINFILISKDDPLNPPLTFIDVDLNYWAWAYIESLSSAGITGGCSTNMYCPESSVTRAQMAVFLEKGIHGSSYSPPDVAPTFNDTAGTWAEDWIEALKSDGVTGGCGGGNYCPNNPVTRAQMAVFLLKSKYGSGYTPPDVGGSTGFTDVPITHWAAPWIKQLAGEGITGGCGGGNYCPNNRVTRAQMAVFLVKTFNLP